jgi:hypothetical protein
MPSGFEHMWGTVLTAALVLFVIYRRFRRNFGRQALNPKRMIVRMSILSVIGVLLLPAALRSAESALSIGAGLVVGVLLGLWGAKHTRFEWHEDKLHYVPHTYTGMIVSALFLGRVIYRFVALSNGGYAPADAAAYDSSSARTLGSLYQNPLTLSVFFVLIGYYVYYYSCILWESKHLKREVSVAPTAAN